MNNLNKTRLLLFILAQAFFSSCNAQIKSNAPKASAAIATKHPKITKPKGSNEYDCIGAGLQDKSGNLWFISTDSGVYKYDGNNFTNYTEKDGLSNNYVYCVLEDKSGNIWFGTADGACYFDGKQFKIIPITEIQNHDSLFLTDNISNAPYAKTKSDSFGMPYPVENGVTCIMQDKTGVLWFGTTRGVYRYNGKSYTQLAQNDGVTNDTGVKIGGYAYGVEYFLEDKKGNVWFGGRGTAGVFSCDGKSLTNYKQNQNNWLWPLFEDKSGSIWFGNWFGTFIYDGKTFNKFTADGSTKFVTTNGDKVENIRFMKTDKKGNIWFVSNNDFGGLYLYNGEAFTHFTTKNGLTGNSVSGILEDKDGNLWIGTSNTGLCRYDGRTFSSFSE